VHYNVRITNHKQTFVSEPIKTIVKNLI